MVLGLLSWTAWLGAAIDFRACGPVSRVPMDHGMRVASTRRMALAGRPDIVKGGGSRYRRVLRVQRLYYCT